MAKAQWLSSLTIWIFNFKHQVYPQVWPFILNWFRFEFFSLLMAICTSKKNTKTRWWYKKINESITMSTRGWLNVPEVIQRILPVYSLKISKDSYCLRYFPKWISWKQISCFCVNNFYWTGCLFCQHFQ